MKKFLWSLSFLFLPCSLLAETVTGVLDELNPTSNMIVVNGVAYEASVENIPIYYNQRRISWQDLHPGDELSLVLSDEPSASVERTIEEIIVIRGQMMPPGD